MGFRKILSLAVVLTLVFVGTTAFALPEAGSVLIFPLFDSTRGAGSILCVTNTFTSQLRCPDNFLEGDVIAHYTYFAGDTCREFDRFEFLTPGDTLCVVADDHNPEGEIGFLVVVALHPQDRTPVTFNNLVGQAIVVESDFNFAWSYTPVSFKALAEGSACDRVTPDDDGDGAADFDGVEYEKMPRELAVPTFFEESARFSNRLTLMSTTGPNLENEVRFLLYNNIEDPFSRTLRFTCWFSAPLSEISAVASDLRGDENEIGHNTENGWVSIRGTRVLDLAGNPVKRDDHTPLVPALLGVFSQLVTGTNYAMGDTLYGRGEMIDGLELPFGDRDRR